MNGRLGTSVALSGNRAFVGSPGRNLDGDTLAMTAWRGFDWVHPQSGENLHLGATIDSIYVLTRNHPGIDQWGLVQRLNAPGMPDIPTDREYLPDSGRFGNDLAVTDECITMGQS